MTVAEARPDWLLPDEFFYTEVAKGYHYAAIVAHAFAAHGLDARLAPMQLCIDKSGIRTFRDEFDLVVEDVRVEVKSHRKRYHGPNDFPYPWVLVDTCVGWDAKVRHPVAEILISQPTLGMCVIPMTSRPEWRRNHRYDTIRKMELEFYEVGRDALRGFEDLVRWFKR